MGPIMQREYRAQSGFAMAIILMLLIVLTVMGSIAVYSVKGEVRHSGRNSDHIRAQMVAESAINWALSGLQHERTDVLPFTAATHAANGADQLPDFMENGKINPRKLHTWDMVKVYPSQEIKIDTGGWISQSTLDANASLTGANDETLAFKIWFPTDSTIRVSGQGTVDGVSSQVEMTGTMKYDPVDMR
jgi:Tfp pilus assembly protein PilX